jgi:hypothetical protein
MTGMLKEIEGAANTLGTKLQFVPATGGGDLEPAFAAMIKERAQAIMIFPSPMLYANTAASSISRQATACRQSTRREKARTLGVWFPTASTSPICHGPPPSIWKKF